MPCPIFLSRRTYLDDRALVAGMISGLYSIVRQLLAPTAWQNPDCNLFGDAPHTLEKKLEEHRRPRSLVNTRDPALRVLRRLRITGALYLHLRREGNGLEWPRVVEVVLLQLGLHLGAVGPRGVRPGVLAPVHHAHTPRDLAQPAHNGQHPL